MICDIAGLNAPKRATKGSAGYDIQMPFDYTFTPDEYAEIDTGLRIPDDENIIIPGYICETKDIMMRQCAFVPATWVILIMPRSSLGTKYGLSFSNTISVIDKDYRDTIKLHVGVTKELSVKKGDRIAQYVIFPFCCDASEKVPAEKRNGGIGSTGI